MRAAQFAKLQSVTTFFLTSKISGLPFAQLTCETGGQNGDPRIRSCQHSRPRLSAQLEILKAAGAHPIYREKISGVRADRPQLAKMMASLKAGDIVTVTKLDRLGRSTRELLELIERISKAGASFRSLGDPLWDTSSSQGRLLSTLLAAIADFERDLIRERTGEGRKRAMANGVKFGRKPKLSDYQRAEAIKRRNAGETLAAIAKSYGVDLSMISRL
jgi:DNA invertase Pin-like site-specific DNA recombinase